MSKLAKQILNKWATSIIKKNAIYIKDGKAGVNQNKLEHYSPKKYSEDIVLWIAPKNCIRLEFEDTLEKNKRYISEIESGLKSLEIDYCISYHNGGKSAYINIFNIKGIPLTDDNKLAKNLWIDMFTPSQAKAALDKTNLGWTLSPVIDHPHWKPKYKDAVHKIVAGKNPLEHENKYPTELLRKIEVAKKNIEKSKKNWQLSNEWVEDFLLNYCCNNKLPKGERHSVIEKNLAALIIFRKEREEIKQKWREAQETTTDTMRGWEVAILNGQFTEVSAGELANYIKKNELDYQIPKTKKKAENKVKDEVSTKELVQNYLLMRKPEQATELMAQYFLKNEHIYSTRDDIKSEMWIYKDGIYVPQAKSYIKEFVRENCGTGFTTHLCNNTINKVEAETFIEQEKFFIVQDYKKIAVQNGILDVVERKLYPFSPDMFFFNKLPVSYDESAKCDNVKGFFKSILYEGDELVIQELFGYLLYRDYKFEKAFMFTGSGRNGKGKCVELMKRFIGVENCANISLQKLESDNFAMSELFMKMANLSADISSKALKETGDFKSLVGHDMITAARKFLRPVSFTNFAKMVFCANELPRTSDTSTAFFNRWILIDFPYTFYSEHEIEKLSEDEKKWVKQADKSIIDKISSQDELNGLLNWALDGLQRLIKQDEFTFSKGTKEIKLEWLRKSNSFNAFCMDCLEENYHGQISKAELRRVYVLYCRDKKVNPVTDKTLRETLLGMFGCSDKRILQDDSRVWVWEGVSFKENYDNSFIDSGNENVKGVKAVNGF